ncbi:hypothetical protein ACFQX4_01685 [Roseomonas sp. GCM10028921]
MRGRSVDLVVRLLGAVKGRRDPPTRRERLHEDDAAYLIAPLFERLSSLLVAHATPLALRAFIATRTDAGWPLFFLVADLALLLVRGLVVVAVRRRRDPSPTALLRASRPNFAIGVA